MVVFAITVVLAIVGLFVSSVSGWWWPLIGLVVVGAVLAVNEGRVRSIERSVPSLAGVLLGRFVPSGTPEQVERLSVIVDRLVATFGTSPVEACIVSDPAANAALLPTAAGTCLIVTSAMMDGFPLIEIEGVVAHLLARERLGLLPRLAAASLGRWNAEPARRLAGRGVTFRADEVAAAAIRYPMGLANALERCASQGPLDRSIVATDQYRQTRWVWFDVDADRDEALEGELDDPRVRARALSEW
jgi:Zn-dependent protease with chaperone function